MLLAPVPWAGQLRLNRHIFSPAAGRHCVRMFSAAPTPAYRVEALLDGLRSIRGLRNSYAALAWPQAPFSGRPKPRTEPEE
jgi:hypothetical protein